MAWGLVASVLLARETVALETIFIYEGNGGPRLYRAVTRSDESVGGRPDLGIWAGRRRRRLGANPVLGSNKKLRAWRGAPRSGNLGREAAEAIRN